MHVDYTAWATRNANEQARLFVEALSGPNFATTTLVTTVHGSAVQSWTERAGFDLQAFVGQTIKLRFRVDGDWGRQSKARIARITTA
jgi:hypothetical protein